MANRNMVWSVLVAAVIVSLTFLGSRTASKVLDGVEMGGSSESVIFPVYHPGQTASNSWKGNFLTNAIRNFSFSKSRSGWKLPVITAVLYSVLTVFLPGVIASYKLRCRKLENADVDKHWDSWQNSVTVVTAVHNFALSIASLAMLCGLIYGACEKARNFGWRTLFCDSCEIQGGMSMVGTLGFWCYMFYLSKYWELADTILLMLKGRKLSVLHVWHHSVVLPLSWYWMKACWTPTWVAMTINTCVHVFMYYYFGMREISGHVPSWKPYLTVCQLVQFWVDLAFVVSNLAKLDSCPGDPWVMLASLAFSVSLLGLFVHFFVVEYMHAHNTKAK